MNIRLLLLLFFFYNLCFSQVSKPPNKADTLIPFFGEKPFRLHGYNNRVIPFDSKNPLHVLITFEESNKPNFEYFRIDSTSYLVQEYFRDIKGSSNDGVKSRGTKIVKNNIIGESKTTVKSAGSSAVSRKELHYFKEFSKEGEWEEYEDSIFHHIYWKGLYKNDKKVGIWKHIVYGIGDDFLIEEIDYENNPTLKIYSTNIIMTIPIDSLKSMLIGRWDLRGCDEENESRMFYSKSQMFGSVNETYYDFTTSTNFIRQTGEGNKFKENCINGQWNLIDKDGVRYIEIKFTNRQVWLLKILYIDKELNLITDRQKNYY